jgi:hypothetical protein
MPIPIHPAGISGGHLVATIAEYLVASIAGPSQGDHSDQTLQLTHGTSLHAVGQEVHSVSVGATEVSAFLSSLAITAKISASTENQALNAILFLYRDVLKITLPWLENVHRAKRPKHLPVVLTREDVKRTLAGKPARQYLRQRCGGPAKNSPTPIGGSNPAAAYHGSISEQKRATSRGKKLR